MEKQKRLKFIAAAAVIAITIIALVVGVFSSTNNHFVVDVIKEEATETDDFLKVTEKILKPAGQAYFDSETLDYQVKLNNKKGASRDNRVAIVIDSSYSMQSNNGFDIAKQKAALLATGILNNVASTRILVASNNGVKQALTNNISQVTTSINSITSGESNDCNYGLEQAFTNLGSGTNVTSTIIYFTDSTDSVSDTMRAKMAANPDLNIISVLVDLTSSAYLDLSTAEPVAGKVYVLPNEVEIANVLPTGVIEYDENKIYDELNLATNNIRVENTFDDVIKNYFDFDESTVAVDMGEIELTKTDGKVTGYVWTIDQIKFQKTATLTFTIKFNPRTDIDAGVIFNEISTNKTQNITYNEYNSDRISTLPGVDSREGTESTVIKICQGYDIKVKAVSDSNYDLPVEGVRLKITGNVAEGEDETELGDEVCSLEKVTDKDGYITITADEAKSLRGDGKIIYTVKVLNTDSLIGYEETDSLLFAINNNRVTRKLEFDSRGFEINESVVPDEKTRSVTVRIPIESSKIDLAIIAHEYGNSTAVLSNCEFELIQPKLNNKYEMSVLTGTTDADGRLILHPTVMTKDGEYNYILRQVNAPSSYEITPMALIKIRFENGKIVPAKEATKELTTLYNDNVKARLDPDRTTAEKDYVEVTVEDICVDEDPFDLQINLKDSDDSTPLKDAVYLVETINSLGQNKKEYVTTDENGQVNVKLYGTKWLTVNITEQTPRVGYQKNTEEKRLIFQRVDGILNDLIANPTSSIGADYNVGYLLNEVGEQVGIKVNLGSHKKAEQNVVKVILVDAEEHDVAVGRNVYYDLYDDNGVFYGPAASDRNGELSFIVGNEEPGNHTYHLVVDGSTVPPEFDQTRIDSPIDIMLNFDTSGYITADSQVLSPPSTIIDEGYETLSNTDNIDYTYHVKIGYFLDSGTTFKFKTKLTDKDTGAALEGAKYNIDIKWDVLVDGNYITRTKTITRRLTDSTGYISTSIPKADEVIIAVREVEPKLGYTIDTAEQEIKVAKTNTGGMRIVDQTPYDLGATNTSEPGKGASIDTNGNDVTFYHQNKKRTAEDTYINLNIRLIDKKTDSYVNGKLINTKSTTLEDGKGNKLDTSIISGSQTTADGSTFPGEIIYNYEDFAKGNPDSYTIKVPGITAFTDETQEIPYEMTISEKDAITGVTKRNTEIKARFIFRNLGNKVKLTDVEIIAGNRLVKSRKFSSASDTADISGDSEITGKFGGSEVEDTLGVFIGNCILDIYTNYDEVGNFSLDLKKESVSDTPEELNNAKYDIKLVNPDSTVLIKNNIVVKNGSTSEDIELEGLTVSEGSYIYLNERTAPIGYAVNTNTETLYVESINELGQITLKHIDNQYDPERLTITKLSPTVLEDSIKENYEVKLKDYGLDVFKFQINTIDDQSLAFVPNFNFKITTSMGGYATARSGDWKTLGSNPPSTTVEYTITPQLPAATYYKKLTNSFKVRIVFDASGSVDEVATRAAQTDANYNSLWKIDSITQTKEGNLKLSVYVEHLDKLEVKVNTIDAITNATVNDVNYRIPQSVTTAEGSSTLQVGYTIEEGTAPTYTLNQISLKSSYKAIGGVNFTVDYTNNVVTGVNIASLQGAERQPTIAITGNKQVTITIYVEPKVPFEFTNVKYFKTDDPLSEAKFDIIEIGSGSTAQVLTDASGKGAAYNTIFERSTYKMFLVKQIKAAVGYAKVDDFYIKVVYDENKKIESATLVDRDENEITDNRFVTIGFVTSSTYSSYNNNNNGIVTILVKSYPEFQIHINDIDRRNDDPINGTEYSVTSVYSDLGTEVNFTSDSGIITAAYTEEDGTSRLGWGIAHLDKTRFNAEVIYTVKEVKPANGYQTLGAEIKVRVVFSEDGYVQSTELVDSTLTKIAKVEKINPVVFDQDNFRVNLELKNNPLLKINITALNENDHSIPVGRSSFTAIGKYNGTAYSFSSASNSANLTTTPETVITGVTDGKATMYMDKTLDGTLMTYTVKEVKKTAGYEWLPEDIVFDVTYDGNGKMNAKPQITGTPGTFSQIIDYDPENFIINMEIYMSEVEEFGIHVEAVDSINTGNAIPDVVIDAYLTAIGDTGYSTDGVHQFAERTEDRSKYQTGYDYSVYDAGPLVTGICRTGTGSPDYTHGEDYKTMGKYETTNGVATETRTLRLEFKNPTQGTGNQAHYMNRNNAAQSIGYYQGNVWHQGYYQAIRYNCLIDITFNDNGEITNASLRTGKDTNIGWLCDSQYIEVTHTKYRVGIKIKLNPMFQFKVNTMDNYTGLPLDGKINISTSRKEDYARADELIRRGYIGDGTGIGGNITVPGEVYSGENVVYVPIEPNGSRIFYLFENAEPTNYQKYSARKVEYTRDTQIGAIEVVYDEYGSVGFCGNPSDGTLGRNVNYTGGWQDICKNDGGGYFSRNNLQKWNYKLKYQIGADWIDTTTGNPIDGYENKIREYQLLVGYSLTTKIYVTAKDAISGDAISNIRMFPFVNNTYKTNTNYKWSQSETGYRTTNTNGQAGWEYWGAAIQDTQDKYIIGSARSSSDYDGYLFPSDMASGSIGGSGNQGDYFVKLDVQYDNNGKISSVTSVGSDLWGDDNCGTIRYDSATGKIYVDVLYNRNLQVKLNKIDFYDKTISLKPAIFNVTSNKGLTTTISTQAKMTPLGKVYKNTTVKYTLSETVAPPSYYPIPDTIDFYVTFDEDGNITKSRVNSTSEYFAETETTTASSTKEKNKTKPDLTISIRNKPAFYLNVRVIDKFYRSDGISDVYLNITNSKGDVASGNPQTDSRGYAEVAAGPIYPNETVIYYISQTNTAPGYYSNTTEVQLEVKFNGAGKVEDCRIISGGDVINAFNADPYRNTRKVSLQMMNMPKDIKFGIYKYDDLTKEAMENVKFEVTRIDVSNGRSNTYEMTTELDGNIVGTIDNFTVTTSGQTIKYIIHETETPASYRKMTDMIILAKYNPDGSFNSAPIQLETDDGFMCSNCSMSVASAGAIKYLDGQRVHYRLDISNDNKYDIVIKNEDKNFTGLGIEGSTFDVSVDGVTYTPAATDQNGITTVKDLTGTGSINIRIAQNKAGEGYKTDLTNIETILLDKGTSEYTLDLNSAQNGYVDDKNATSSKAVIYVDEERGKIYITFTNETELSLTLFKKDYSTGAGLADAEFEVTAQQVHPTTGDNIGDEIKLTNDGKVYTTPDPTPDPGDTTGGDTTGGDTTGGDTTGGDTTGGDTTSGDTTGGDTTGGDTTGGDTTGGDTTGGDTTGGDTTGGGSTEPEYIIDPTLVHNKTNEKGKLKFDLGVAPQSQKWIFTFKEITPPDGYYEFTYPLQLEVSFDQYGRISEIKNPDTTRLSGYKANDNVNCRDMYADFMNKKIDPARPDDPNLPPDYQVRVVTRDVDTKRIINNSEIQLDIINPETGDPVVINPKTVGSMQNGEKALTTNIGRDYNRYTDEEVFGNRAAGIAGNGVTLIGRGMVYIDNINHEGDFTIQVSQTGFAEGYVPGTQKTDATIQLNATYTQDMYGDYQVEFTSIDEDGMQINKDKVNKVITITLYNESEMKLNLLKVVHGTDPYEPIPHVSFNVTSSLHSLVDVTDTGFTTTTSATNAQGRSSDPVGRAYASKTEVFTLHENDNDAYETLSEDIQIEVQYDIDGYIKNYELLTSQEYVNIEPTTDKRHIDITVRNKQKVPNYEVQVEKHKLDTEEELEAYNDKLPGATYRVQIHQEENGEEYPANIVRVTNDDGMIIDPALIQTGFGYITVTLEELETPEGYTVDHNAYKFRFYRHEDGRLSFINSGSDSTISDEETGVNYEIISTESTKYKLGDTTKVILKPVDRQKEGRFTLAIDKYSVASKKLIENNHAKFSARIIKLDEDGILLYEDTITENLGRDLETGDDGRLEISNLLIPEEMGNYKLVLRETQAPEGYEEIVDPIVIDFSVKVNSEGQFVLETTSTENENVIVKNKDQLVFVRIGNEVADEIGDDEYSLDITKVDANVVDDEGNYEPIENMAIFKVKIPDDKNTSVYTETSQTIRGPGKLDYCFIEENKDYTVRLTHMPKPTEPTTLTYEFKEIVAPDGYGLIPETVTMELDFGYDDDGEMAILGARSSNENYLKILTATPAKLDESFKVDILNREAEQSKFTIHYDDNVEDEVITVPNDQIKEKNVDITLSDYIPTREGYDFLGWGLIPTSTEPYFKPGDTFTLNQDITLYAIWEDELYLKSTEYLIGEAPAGYTKGVETKYKDGDLYISRILPYVVRWHNDRTTIAQFKENLVTNATTIEVFKQDGTLLSDDDFVGTNMKLKLTKGSRVIEITTVVTGDCADSREVCTADNNADGRITKADASALSGHIVSLRRLEGAYLLAADVNYDGRVSTADKDKINYVISGVVRDGILTDF